MICVVLDHPSMNLISPICQLIQCHDLGKLVENYAVPSNFMQYMSQENYNTVHNEKKTLVADLIFFCLNKKVADLRNDS